MPPHHHRRGGFRGGRSGYRGPDAYEEILIVPSDLDVLLVPPTDEAEAKVKQAGMTFFDSGHNAGDLFGTIVTPDDAKHYLSEVDTGYSQLDAAIQSSITAPPDFKASWVLQIGTWKAFFVGASASVGWLNTKAVMDQTDRFNQQLADWRKSFASVGGVVPGPPPIAPGQGIPGSGNPTSDITKIVAAVGVVAAIVVFGPTLMRTFSH